MFFFTNDTLRAVDIFQPTAEKVAAKLKKPVINIKFGSRTENSWVWSLESLKNDYKHV